MKQMFLILYQSASDWLESESGKLISKIIKYLIQIAIIGILLYQILDIGIENIIQELPAEPLFYVFFLLIYFTLPLTEYITYNISWRITFWKSQAIFLKKRVYNKTVLGYSGEVQLFFWLEKELGIPKKEAFKVVRDNNTLSTLASTFVAITLLAVFIISGQIKFLDWVSAENALYGLAGLVAFVVILVIFRRLREFLFSMKKADAFKIFGIHTARMFLLTVFQVLQWYVVVPEVSLSIWFTLVAMQLILSRIPFLPNKDLIFIGAGLEFGQTVDISIATLAGLLLVHHILDKVMNLAVFAYLSVQEKSSGK